MDSGRATLADGRVGRTATSAKVSSWSFLASQDTPTPDDTLW
jgi:hypothetical protein